LIVRRTQIYNTRGGITAIIASDKDDERTRITPKLGRWTIFATADFNS